MKRSIVFTAFLSLFVFSLAASAQEKVTNFGGSWTLDLTKSKLDDRAKASIESQTLTATQTDKDIKVETATKRLPPPADAPQGGRRGGGMMGGGDSALTYSLDGNETTVEQESQMGKVPVKLKAKIDGGKLTLSSSRIITGQMGEISITTKETWELSTDGKTLTVNREMTTPRGTNSSTMVYSKKS